MMDEIAAREKRASRFAVGFLLVGALAIAGVVTLLATGDRTAAATSSPAATSTAGQSQTAAGAAATPHAHVYLTILTGHMIGKPGWPMYSPASFQVPANALVTVTIRDMDNGPAAVPAANLKVQGTVGGTESIVPQVLGQISSAHAKVVSAVPAGDVAHTFTSTALGLNVPVPPTSTVTFTFHTGAPGTYTWQCYAPCGTGSTGWSGPMDTVGYMRGVITVAA